MQRNILKHLNKRILCILIFSIIIYIIAGTIPQIMHKSYAKTYTYTSSSDDLPKDFDTKYPDYRILINTLVTEHPEWTFKLYETNLSWSTVIKNESVHGKNLVQPSFYTAEWGCTVCKDPYDGPWRCASKAAIEYMMDPRNFLNSYDVFQFQELASSDASESAVESMIKGTFMDTDKHREECIQAIMDAAEKYTISPYFITSKIIQEQSNDGSELSAGKGYDTNGDGKKEYVGYYNLFNIGAYEDNGKSQIENGLIKAKDKGWDSMYKSILSGAEFIKGSYISVGQSTIYFQKYNVVNKNALYANQYMTNVWGAYSEGKIMRSKYVKYGIDESKFTFTIPLYTDMPKMEGELVYVNVNSNSSLTLKSKPYYNSTHLLSINPKTVLLRIEKAAKKVDGYYWDKVMTPYGIGYMARNAYDNSKQYLVPITLIEPTEKETDTSINNGYTKPDKNEVIYAEPNVTVDKLKETYKDATIVNKDEKEIKGNTLVGTGAKVKIDKTSEYTIVKIGDVSGDGDITPSDYVKVKNKIMGTTKLNTFETQAADANRDGDITPADYVKVKNHIMGASKISL